MLVLKILHRNRIDPYIAHGVVYGIYIGIRNGKCRDWAHRKTKEN